MISGDDDKNALSMSSREDKSKWSVFDGVRTISLTPEALMAEISSAITVLEYAHASAALLQSPRTSVSKPKTTLKS